MRWRLQSQILWPFVGIQAVSLCAIAISSAWLAVRRAEATIHYRLANVIDSLGETSFPLTEQVLQQLRKLSDAEFVVLDPEQHVELSTLEHVEDRFTELTDEEWSQLAFNDLRPDMVLPVGGKNYFASRVAHSMGAGVRQVIVLYPQSEWQRARWEAMRPPLMVGGGLLLSGVLISVLISRRIGQRIRDLQQQVVRISEHDFSSSPLPATDDELRDLTADLNRMATLLENSFRQATEIERSRLLTQLVGGVSHQFRNSITGALMAIQLHQRRCSAPDDHALQASLQQLRLTEEQIKALLRVARGSAAVNSSIHPGDVGEVLRNVIALVRPVCAHQNIQLREELTAGNWEIPDVEAMRAALVNLLMNAAEATGPGGSLTVSTRLQEPRFQLEIRNTGAPPEDVHRIFEPFYSTKAEGVGLGLFLARQAVADCGGVLSCRHANGVTTFEMLLTRNSNLSENTSAD
jgi:signal transduction histidine kinase